MNYLAHIFLARQSGPAMVGAMLGVITLRLRRAESSTPLPFGPYLAVAGWIALLWGDQITGLYLNFAGFR